MLDFKNLQFLSCSPCRPAVLLPHSKFRWNRTIGRRVMAKKANFKMAAAAILNFKKFQYFVTWQQPCFISDVVYQISSKSDDFSLRHGNLTIFKMAAVRHLGFLKNCSFCHLAFVDMPFCFLVQNFAEIGQSVDELWPKKRFFKMAAAAILNFKKFQFLVTWLLWGLISAVVYQILSKSHNFSLRYGDLAIFKNGGRPPSWICCDVTILHRRTHFRCPNIVLKFHVDRCCSFRDTCSIISRPFGCT